MRRFNLGRMLARRSALAISDRRRPTRWAPAVAELEGRVMLSITIAIDYTYDTNRFFDTQAKRDLIQLAATRVSEALDDTLLAIQPGGTNTWTALFPNPSNVQVTQSVRNLVVPANTVTIFVGGSQLGGASEAGEGSTGGFDASGDNNWLTNILSARGKPGALASPATAFGPWGGSIAFDNSGNTSWFFGVTTAGLNSNQTDFLSVAEHEIGHVLGIGTADSWTALVSAGRFVGPAATAANGGVSVRLDPGGDHWADGTNSGGAPAAMDPILTNGTRAVFTALDYAALRDIGWQVSVAAPVVQFGASAYSALETAGSVSLNVTRTGGSGPFSVRFATSDGTGRAGVDYQPVSGTLDFAAGETSKIVVVPILNNLADPTNKRVNLTLSAPTAGATLGSPATAALDIIDAAAPRAIGDFDADGRTDLGVFRPSTAQWVISQSTAGPLTPIPVFGARQLTDVPIIGDFDGIGRAEIGVFRPSTAQWFVLGPTGGRLLGTFGAPNLTDIPVPADYDGVGHAQLAVFRPSTAQWFVLGSTGGRLLGSFGAPNLTDIPVPGDWEGTGRAQPAVFRPRTSQWFARTSGGGQLVATFGAPNLTDIPVPGTYDAAGRVQPAVFRPSTGQWFGLGTGGGFLIATYGARNYQEIPIEAPIGSLMRLGLNARGGRPTAASARSFASAASRTAALATTPAVETASTSTPTSASPPTSPTEPLTPIVPVARRRPAQAEPWWKPRAWRF